ncbi:deoxyribose-phosphate aldolase [Albimonas donghaensis]|uniref:Deoxyribose-phosphate aldolase n=1 Tax=Albimonas donghaensis TaxID=356660 RepID=A0A1H3AKD6_9RHOB|nr:deoxyribose-phosphate aldolase [Albimonas donghaensis]SDX29911.1 deoxyribose-phosphate aldolase [Albimonas donghaensis]
MTDTDAAAAASETPEPTLAQSAARALACLDLTNLNDDCDEGAIRELAAKAVTPYGSVAALCVWPRFAGLARRIVAPDVKVATVVVFPTGLATDEQAMEETRAAILDGADEIDMVIPYRDLMEGRGAGVSARVERVKRAAGTAPVKAILETGVLEDGEMIAEAARLAIQGGADFIKTSTGKVPVNATLSAAELMLAAIAEHGGGRVGFKAAGGVRTTAEAAAYLDIAARVMGPDWAGPTTFRFGASGLLDALLDTLGGGAGDARGEGY